MPDFFTASSTPSLPPKCGSHAATSAFWTETYTNPLDALLRESAQTDNNTFGHFGWADGIDQEDAVETLEHTFDRFDLLDRSPVTALTPAGSFAPLTVTRQHLHLLAARQRARERPGSQPCPFHLSQECS